MNNMTVEEGIKLQNWCDVLIVVTKYSKFESETSTAWLFFKYYVGVKSFFLLIYI